MKWSNIEHTSSGQFQATVSSYALTFAILPPLTLTTVFSVSSVLLALFNTENESTHPRLTW